MSDEPRTKDLRLIWMDQPEERTVMTLDDFVNRRTRELHASTRSEIVMSISAALLFTAVVAWRFASVHERLPQLGVAAVLAWVLVSLYVFRDRIWRPEAPGNGALAATGVDHYRRQLQRRRAHLRNAWLWHGPLLLACLVLAGVILRDTLHAFDRFARHGFGPPSETR